MQFDVVDILRLFFQTNTRPFLTLLYLFQIHTDFPFHKKLKLWRRVNVLVYLNKDWEESWGGSLELWNSDLQNCSKKILPIINRVVIFRTGNGSFHGHPMPLSAPEGVFRRSIALYYYTSDIDPGQQIMASTTNFIADSRLGIGFPSEP